MLFRIQTLLAVLLLTACFGCSPSTGTADMQESDGISLDVAVDVHTADLEAPEGDSKSGVGDDLPLPCADIFGQDFIPVFEIEIDDGPWEQLVKWYKLGPEAIEPKRYVPLRTFRYGDEVYTDAMIRLRGNPYHWWPDPKMQFNISFKQVDEKGRFHGQRKLNLDVAHNDLTMFHDRLGMAFFQELGIPAPCVNHAKLFINGEYFGLYVNIEHVDQEFLQRNFGSEDEGNLYKLKPYFVFDKKTNESDPDISDLEAFEREGLTPEELKSLVDLDEALMEWAGEAVLPHLDGYFVGGVNLQIYNHPSRGFIFIPWDLDYSFEIGGVHSDPITEVAGWGQGKPSHIRTVLDDPELRLRYMDALATATAHFDSDRLVEQVIFFEDQIREAIEADPSLEYSLEEHLEAVSNFKSYLRDREEFLNDWLQCVNKELEVESTTVGDAEFLLVLTPCSRQRATEACEYLGGVLATPSSEEEQNHLTEVTMEINDNDWWIAPSDLEEEGHWTGIEGEELTMTFWAKPEPYQHEWVNCAAMEEYYGGLWVADYCDIYHPFVCRLTGD